MTDLKDMLDDVLPSWLAERPLAELVIVLGWPYVGMVAALPAGVETTHGLVAGVLVSLLTLGYIRLRVSTERLRELQRDPVAALDERDVEVDVEDD